jgi:hypothetical protein
LLPKRLTYCLGNFSIINNPKVQTSLKLGLFAKSLVFSSIRNTKRTRSVEKEGFSDERSSLKQANVTTDVDGNMCDQYKKIDLKGALNFPVANITDTKGI